MPKTAELALTDWLTKMIAEVVVAPLLGTLKEAVGQLSSVSSAIVLSVVVKLINEQQRHIKNAGSNCWVIFFEALKNEERLLAELKKVFIVDISL